MTGFKNFEYKEDNNAGIVDIDGNPQGNFLRVDISEGEYFVDNSGDIIIYKIVGNLSPDERHVTATIVNPVLPRNKGLISRLLEEYNKILLKEDKVRRIEEIEGHYERELTVNPKSYQ